MIHERRDHGLGGVVVSATWAGMTSVTGSEVFSLFRMHLEGGPQQRRWRFLLQGSPCDQREHSTVDE